MFVVNLLPFEANISQVGFLTGVCAIMRLSVTAAFVSADQLVHLTWADRENSLCNISGHQIFWCSVNTAAGSVLSSVKSVLSVVCVQRLLRAQYCPVLPT